MLVTGGTGFIGRSVVRRLVDSGFSIRTLLRPGPNSPVLPHGVPLQVALASLSDRRGIQAAMTGMQAVVHLAGAEREGSEAKLQAIDIAGTQILAEAASQAGVDRIIFLGHLGADRASAYPALRAKAMAEGFIRDCGVPFTILRSGLAFGEGDRFTTALAELLAIAPLVFPLVGDGSTRLQPVWVEDLATVIAWTLDDPTTSNGAYEIGGPEFFTLQEVVELVMEAIGSRRLLMRVPPPYARAGLWLMKRLMRSPLFNTFWVDYLAANRTASLDTLPRVFGLSPARMSERIDYLNHRRWGWQFIRRQLGAPRRPTTWRNR